MTEEQKLKAKVKRQETTINKLRQELKLLRQDVSSIDNELVKSGTRWREAKQALARFLYDDENFADAVISVVRDRFAVQYRDEW